MRIISLRHAWLLVALVLVWPCQADDRKPSKSPVTGTVRGVVKFKGKQIPAKPIVMAADPTCTKYYQGKKAPLNERWKWGKNGTLQNVVVYVSKGLPQKKFPLPKANAKMEQIGCIYVPHVQVIRVGQLLEIHNRDQTLHNPNVQANPPLGGGPIGGVGQPAPGQVVKLRFTDPGNFFIRCDVHAWMAAYVLVLDHPFHDVTGEQGTFEIKGLPPGNYQLAVWHEFRRFVAEKNPIVVNVKGNAVSEVTFTYSPK